MVAALRAIILQADDRITEAVKWNAPSFYPTEHFATFRLRVEHAVVTFSDLAHVHRQNRAFTRLIRQWIEHVR